MENETNNYSSRWPCFSTMERGSPFLLSAFTNSRVIEDSCGRIARVNVACRVTIRPHLLFLGNGTSWDRPGRATEPCKHSIIIVVRENTGLSSGSSTRRLVYSSARRRVALKIMTARALRLRFLSLPFPRTLLSPTSVFSIPKAAVSKLPRFFFVTSCGKSGFPG